eukprot:TRINITY_DN46757_c0_g1_i1.p2 TRINITY_DN46757_c0_g1~~TRINITY_DN46757_c0_g1_i1.p2  ORF type:complete len:198 (+),score=84.43 TRINITY_DN46757_c0_g1_i1:73-666(+)
MSTSPALKKLRKSRRSTATELERSVAQMLFDLEVNNRSMKSTLSTLHINSAKTLEVSATKSACVISYPLRFIRKVHKIQKPLVQELEKKMTGKQVLLVASRKIARKSAGSKKVQRSRTMTAVHEAYLGDIVYPSDVCGRRVRQRVDGSKHLKVYLDARDKDRVDGRLDTFKAAYNTLTGRDVSFGYISNVQMQQVAA